LSARSAWLPLAALCIAAALAWLVLDDNSAEGEESPVPPAEVDASGHLTLSDVQAESLGLETAAAEAADAIAVAGLPAEVAPPLDASARVAAPYAGIVTRVLVDEGSLVEAGEALVRIQSRELLAAQAELARARSEAFAAAQQAQRHAALLEEGIIPASRSEESHARAEAARAAQAQAEGALAGIRIAVRGAPGEYDLLAPIAGRVLRRRVVPGQSVAALEETYAVAAPGELDLTFNVPVELRARLAPGLKFKLPGGGVGNVVAIGADTDRASQSLRVRARAQDDGRLIAGQHLQVTLLVPAPPGAVAVPRTALISQGGRHVLYTRDAQGYRVVPVERLGGGDAQTIVSGAIQPGTQVVVRGASALKSLLAAE
jgi:RND family efflux transporter MFP subunit